LVQLKCTTLAYTTCNAREEQTPEMHTLHLYVRTSKLSSTCWLQRLASSLSVVCCF